MNSFLKKRSESICGYASIKMERVEIGPKKYETEEYNRNNSQDENCIVVLV